jgi:hypothetical protein
MKRRWVIVAITSMALIGAGTLVRTERKNRQLAKWAAVYRTRAEHGDAESQFELAAMYYYGKGVSKDYEEAAQWYRKSAEQGNTNAEYSLAYMYHGGKGVPQDDSEAARWCLKAAEQGNASAEDALGIIYRRGQGVPPDNAEAVRWYRKSAEQGYPQAQYGGAVGGGVESDVYIVRKGAPVKMDSARKILQADPFTGAKLVWKQDHLLQIQYDVAHIEQFRNLWGLWENRKRWQHGRAQLRRRDSAPFYPSLFGW